MTGAGGIENDLESKLFKEFVIWTVNQIINGTAVTFFRRGNVYDMLPGNEKCC